MTALQKLQMSYACGSALGHTPVTSVREVAARLRRLVSLCPLSVSFLAFALSVWSVQVASVLFVRYHSNRKHRPLAPLASSHLDYRRCCLFLFCVPAVFVFCVPAV
jgi:ABC-type uncharacterized transport system permease subunit